MRCPAIGAVMLVAAGCSTPAASNRQAEATVSAVVAFDGADYSNEAAKTAHGKRLATLFTCSG